MKKILFTVLICLSTLLTSYCECRKTEAIPTSTLQSQFDIKQYLTDTLTTEVYTYICSNSKHNEKTTKEISEHIVKRALDNNIDICFILAQGHIETSFGTYGIGKSRKSIFGVYQRFNSYTDCIDYYIELLRTNYLPKRTEQELMVNYVNTGGRRYAQDKSYEAKLLSRYNTIKTQTNIAKLQEKFMECNEVL